MRPSNGTALAAAVRSTAAAASRSTPKLGLTVNQSGTPQQLF